jgi:hypothetical protein
MQQKTSISARVSDFLITTLALSFLNYFEAFATCPDFKTRLLKSILVAACAGLILALTRPTLNGWLKPIIKRNKNTTAGILITFILFTLFIGGYTFLDLLHYKEDANWSMAKILKHAIGEGAISGAIFTLLFEGIKIIRANKNNLKTDYQTLPMQETTDPAEK